MCDCHPDGCGNSLVIERAGYGVEKELCLKMKLTDELVCYVMKPDGMIGCQVLAAKEFVVGENGLRLDGAIVQIIDFFLPDNPNRTVRCLYHHNCGYGVKEVV